MKIKKYFLSLWHWKVYCFWGLSYDKPAIIILLLATYYVYFMSNVNKVYRYTLF